jgi:uncharacterized membrane protein YczE
MMLVGVLAVGIGVGFLRIAGLGIDPYQTFNRGVSAIFPSIDFGMLWWIIAALLIAVPLAFKRSLIGLGTIATTFLTGYIIDGSEQVLRDLLPVDPIVARVAYLIIGLTVVCVGSALYFVANLGVSSYDAIALVLAERRPSVTFRIWRIVTDSTSVVAGVILLLVTGASWGQIAALVGVGTVLLAGFMGPVIAYFRRTIAEPILRLGVATA